MLLLFEALGYSIGREHFPDPSLEFLREPRVLDLVHRGLTPPWPDVIKHLGGFCYHLNEHVDRWNWHVEHVVVMVRDLEISVNRRMNYGGGRDMTARAYNRTSTEWKALTSAQKRTLARDHLKDELGSLIFQLVARDYSFSCLEYPRWILDPEYAFRKLSPPLCDRSTFLAAHREIVDPGRIGHY